MQPDGQTNLWDGLEKGLEVLRVGNSRANSAVFLLTDGQPNVEPPRGHLPMLKKYRDQHGGYPGIINTFGFGYNLDSKLLNELATEGNGTYAFIPDGSFVGTIFVNALSNLLTNAAVNVCLSLEFNKDKINNLSLIEKYNHNVTSWGLEIRLGSVTMGQDKHILLPLNLVPGDELVISMEYYDTLTNSRVVLPSAYIVESNSNDSIDVQKCRLLFVNLISSVYDKMRYGLTNESVSLVSTFSNNLKSFKFARDELVVGITKDLEDQVYQAVSILDSFNKWGKHYLPSLARAHLLEQCNNFKDPGVQNYGGKLFRSVRDAIDDIFMKLPAPKPSTSSYGSRGYSTYTTPVSMSVFNNSSNPCFDGDCLVTMADGSFKSVKDIRMGDRVVSNGCIAIVKCVLKTISNTG